MPEPIDSATLRQQRDAQTERSLALPIVDGPWHLIETVHTSPLSTVYRAAPSACRSAANACYALKVYGGNNVDSAVVQQLVQREAMVGNRIHDPHVVSILDWNIRKPPYYVVMPLLQGAPLEEYLTPDKPLSLSLACWIARQTAQALDALHQEGFVHADIKPANIFVGRDGHTTLLDLGFCRTKSEITQDGNIPLTGTFHYMAPETFTSKLVVDIRSDIYSLGVSLYQMLTGRLPYEGRNPLEIAQLQLTGVPDRLRCLNPLLPGNVVALVRSMIAKEPLRRPQTPGELISRLTALEIETFAQRVSA